MAPMTTSVKEERVDEMSVKMEEWEAEEELWEEDINWHGLMPPLWEEPLKEEEAEEEEEECMAFLHSEMGLPLMAEKEEAAQEGVEAEELDQASLLALLVSSLKEEPPLSVAFVGSEQEGTAATALNNNGNNLVVAQHYNHHSHHPHHYHLQQPHQIIDNYQTSNFSDFSWTGEQQQQCTLSSTQFLNDQQQFGHSSNPEFPLTTTLGDCSFSNSYQPNHHHHHHFHHSTQPQTLHFTDISSSTPFEHPPPIHTLFDPLSVDSSTSWSGGAAGGEQSSSSMGDGEAMEEYSSLSQDEIFEEIQRECAEIERRSTSGSPSNHHQQTAEPAREAKRGTKKMTNSKRKAAYSGRASMSSVGSSADGVGEKEIVKGGEGKGGVRKERKKALNRVAATRYREKKRKEREETEEELNLLEERNARLRADILAVQTEMDYLKKLTAEIEVARKAEKNSLKQIEMENDGGRKESLKGECVMRTNESNNRLDRIHPNHK